MQSVLNHSQPNQDQADATLPAARLANPPRPVAPSTDDPRRLAVDNSRDLANLDLLRTVAVTLVFADHLAATANIRGLGDIGRLGVLIFFVHTSLVLMLSMERLGLTGFRLYSAFLVRRVFRIYPLSIFAVLTAVIFRIPAASWIGGFEWIGWRTFFSSIFLTQNITHSESLLAVLWSLPFEMQMYLVLPLLFLLLSRYRSLKFASLIWLLGVGIAWAEWAFQHGNADMNFLLTRYVPCFLAGVFAWRIMATPVRRLPAVLWILFLLLLVVAYRAVDVIRVYGPAAFDALHGAVRTDHEIWWPHSLDLVRDWVFCAATGIVLPFFREIRIGWLNGLSRKVALYSYGIYVAHVPAMWLCFDLLHTGSLLVGALLSIVLTAALAILLYHLLEHPAILLGKRLSINLIPVPVLS
jgi:peptidoglycan/LPS O-acetylase OafA/YrhL